MTLQLNFSTELPERHRIESCTSTQDQVLQNLEYRLVVVRLRTQVCVKSTSLDHVPECVRGGPFGHNNVQVVKKQVAAGPIPPIVIARLHRTYMKRAGHFVLSTAKAKLYRGAYAGNVIVDFLLTLKAVSGERPNRVGACHIQQVSQYVISK